MDTLARVDIRDSQRVWIKMNNWGFGYYDREADQIVPLSNVKEQQDYRFMNGVACFEVDSTGVLWMSTAARGLESLCHQSEGSKDSSPYQIFRQRLGFGNTCPAA